MKKLFFLILLGFITPVYGQQKGSFLDRVNNGLQKVNQTLQTGQLPPASKKSSGGSIFSAGKTIRGEWKEYGAGGMGYEESLSPRNHTYSFELSQDNIELKGRVSSSGAIWLRIFSSNGDEVGRADKLLDPDIRSKVLRKGVYLLQVGQRERGDTSPYEVELIGDISNIQKIEPQYVVSNDNFGDEGGGGKLLYINQCRLVKP